MVQDGRAYSTWEAYGQSKTANMLFTLELARRLKPKNMHSFSLHPGGTFQYAIMLPARLYAAALTTATVVATNLGAHLDQALLDGLSTCLSFPLPIQTNIPTTEAADIKSGFPSWGLRYKTIDQGCATHLVAAFDPSISEYNGGYLEDCTMFIPLKEYAADLEAAGRLWALSEEMVREKFEF